jgi:hypothetical protein
MFNRIQLNDDDDDDEEYDPSMRRRSRSASVFKKRQSLSNIHVNRRRSRVASNSGMMMLELYILL